MSEKYQKNKALAPPFLQMVGLDYMLNPFEDKPFNKIPALAGMISELGAVPLLTLKK